MLVLSRRAGEELVIAGNIRIVVNRVAGNRVTLGIEAPDDVRILRGELEEVATQFEAETPEPGTVPLPGFQLDSQTMPPDSVR